jgi:peptidoglycan/LPS O-acetylase OafA/YrhL
MSAMIETTRSSVGPGATPPLPGEPHGRGPARKFRPDIEGVRALAVLLVVLYHAHLLGVSGGYVGVDVFFVLSGFLITRQLVAGVDKRGVRELPSFYARRIKRLLPASTVVAVTTVLAAYVWLPVLQAKQVAMDAIFTTFYGLNYRLAYNGTSYLHQSDVVSPLQHFWSLGVEEQFYVFWPVLIVLALILPLRVRYPALVVLLAVIAGVSFWYCATTTVESPSWSYFSIHTRAWELALGGLVALSEPLWTRLPRVVSNLAAWGGFATVLASGYLLSDATVYPGTMAAVPVVSTAVVLAAGCAPRHHSIERLLSEPVLQGIGKISYSWYLWHWPMLVIFPIIAGESLGWPRRVEVVFLSLLFAILSYHMVENPVRRLRRLNFEWVRTGLALAATVLVVSVVASNTLITTGDGVAARAVTIAADSKADHKVQVALKDALTLTKAPRNLTPGVDKAGNDFPVGCITQIQDTSPDQYTGSCWLGAETGDTFAIFGDSHAQQWATGLDKTAKQLGYRIVVRTKSACPAVDMPVYNSLLKREYTECTQWRPAAIAKVIAAHPKFVIISQADAIAGADTADHTWADATARTITKFTDAGIKVMFFLDTPLINENVPQCVGDHLNHVQTCNLTTGKRYAYPSRHAAVARAAEKAGATVVEPAQWLCTTQGCPTIVGNILVYRDNVGHMTSTYSKWLSPVLTNLLVDYTGGDENAKRAGQVKSSAAAD